MSACGMRRSHSVSGIFGVACCKPSAEMILPGLDCTLGRVLTVNMGGNALEVDGVFFEF
jgi:hypothetical protein